jgi:hypothetical protein
MSFGRISLKKREEIILEGITLGRPRLEIGPSFRPITSKNKGHNVKTFDYATAEELRIKYASQGIDVSKIEEVDIVWRGAPNGTFTKKFL